MRRIFSDYAYGPGPREWCWWDETVALTSNPVLQGSIHTDVAIVGGGFTGLSAAYHLAKAGASVAVVDANAVGWGASGRNGGFCCLGGGMASDAALDRRFGRAARLEWRQTEKAAVALVDQVVSDLRLDVERHSTGETVLAHRPRDARGFAQAAQSVRDNYGVEAEILSSDQLDGAGMAGPFHGAMTIPIGFALNPRKYLSGLYAAGQRAGVQFFDHSAATQVGAGSVQTAQGSIIADQIILATNGYSSEDIPAWMAGRYMPAQSSVIVTEPIGADMLEQQGWTSDQMAYDSRQLLHYFRLMPDRRFLFGMRGGTASSPRAEVHSRQKVIQDFRRMFPAWGSVEISHAWSGMVCLARGMLPFVGPVPGSSGVLAGFAYHGNGVAMGTLAGQMLADLALGQTPLSYPKVIQTPAQRFPLGIYRRAIMPPMYAAFQLGDLRP